MILVISKIYQSFGYNNIQIEYKSEDYSNNSSDVYLYFNEGEITKINKININGNTVFDKNTILSKIKSKTKKITNIFANNNFKIFELNNDIIRIKNFYKQQGYKDVNVEYELEFYANNKVEISFLINEGQQYFFNDLNLQNNLDKNKNIEDKILSLIDKNQNKSINIYQKFFPKVKFDWTSYFNSGFLIYNKDHKKLVKTIKDFWVNNDQELYKIQKTYRKGNDQTPVNYMVRDCGFEINYLLNYICLG